VDSLILPVLTQEHTIDHALERMAQTNSRAIVVQHLSEGYALYLYMNRVVVDAWKMQEPTCAKLRAYGGEAVPVLDRFNTPTTVGSLEQLIERQLDELSALLGALFVPRSEDDLMMVVTRYETKRDEVTLAGLVCGCAGPIRHTEASPPAATGGSCPICGFVYTCW
jgi:hypothetical protein